MTWLATLARWLDRAGIHARRAIGRGVERRGNQVTIHGLNFSVDNPLITTREKALFYMGIHEAPEIKLARRHLDVKLPLIELGGGVGVLSCILNRKLTHPQDHVVLEANPELIPTLEINRRMNQCEFRILPVAVAYDGPETELTIDSLAASRVGGAGQRRVQVRTTTLAHVLKESGFARVNLIADIEGAEVKLVEREADLLGRQVQTLILETHPRFTGIARTTGMLAQIRSLGFVEAAHWRHVYAFKHRALKTG